MAVAGGIQWHEWMGWQRAFPEVGVCLVVRPFADDRCWDYRVQRNGQVALGGETFSSAEAARQACEEAYLGIR